MRALVVGLSGLIGVLCLSDSAMAQTRNTVTINLHNNTKHSIGLHDVRSMPQAKNRTWNPQTVSRGDKGKFIGYWDDDQAPSLMVEFDGYTSGPYGCHVSCSIDLQIQPSSAASKGGYGCPYEPEKPKYTVTSNNNSCGTVNCSDLRTPSWNKDTCSYIVEMEWSE